MSIDSRNCLLFVPHALLGYMVNGPPTFTVTPAAKAGDAPLVTVEGNDLPSKANLHIENPIVVRSNGKRELCIITGVTYNRVVVKTSEGLPKHIPLNQICFVDSNEYEKLLKDNDTSTKTEGNPTAK